VADAADPPKAKTPEIRVWTPAQLRAFLDHGRGDRLYSAWLLAATTGMHRGAQGCGAFAVLAGIGGRRVASPAG
jgi:hypothetical protein